MGILAAEHSTLLNSALSDLLRSRLLVNFPLSSVMSSTIQLQVLGGMLHSSKSSALPCIDEAVN